MSLGSRASAWVIGIKSKINDLTLRICNRNEDYNEFKKLREDGENLSIEIKKMADDFEEKVDKLIKDNLITKD